jgi:phage terminase small subunit
MSKIKLSDEQKAMAEGLTSLQRKTVVNIVSGMSNRQAYKKAGGKAKKPQTQDTVVSKMLIDTKVKAFYNSLMNGITEKAVFSKERAISMLETMANVTIKDFYNFERVITGYEDEVDEEGNVKPIYASQWIIKNPEDIPDDIARCIKSYKMTKNGPELEIYDKQGAVKQLSNMIGWDAPKKTELTGKDGEALQVKSEIKAPEIANALAGLMEKL